MRKGDKKSCSDLMREADTALYQSKKIGKNRVTGYDETLTMPGENPDDKLREP
jgi:hypothetical protein